MRVMRRNNLEYSQEFDNKNRNNWNKNTKSQNEIVEISKSTGIWSKCVHGCEVMIDWFAGDIMNGRTLDSKARIVRLCRCMFSMQPNTRILGWLWLANCGVTLTPVTWWFPFHDVGPLFCVLSGYRFTSKGWKKSGYHILYCSWRYFLWLYVYHYYRQWWILVLSLKCWQWYFTSCDQSHR